MKTVALLFVTASISLLATGCNNKNSTENQSTNEPWVQQPATNANSSSGAETTNTAPATEADTNSAGMDTNMMESTNNTNAAPP
jgi:uncharacterized lipoprotein YajG